MKVILEFFDFGTGIWLDSLFELFSIVKTGAGVIIIICIYIYVTLTSPLGQGCRNQLIYTATLIL